VSSAPIPANEAARLAALARLGILDTPNEPEFDQIVAEAAAMANTPMSLISFVTDSRQWFKASTGVEAKETNRSAAFCAWAIFNAATDERFHDNALVTGDPNIRAYAGVPINSPDGFLLGTLCVIDDKPKAFDQAVVDQLKTLAARVSQLLIVWKRSEQNALGRVP
jgi:GAF domain-containing protein